MMMTDDDLIATYKWTSNLTLRSREMLGRLLDDAVLPDAERATVKAFLQDPRNCSVMLRTPNFGRVSLRELMEATAVTTSERVDPSWKFSDARHWSAIP